MSRRVQEVAMRQEVRSWAVLVAAVVGGAAVMAGPVAASAAARGGVAPRVSPTFAGYQVAKSKGHVTSATTTFVVPSITCKKSFSGVGPSIVVQTTPNKRNVYLTDIAAVGVGCVKMKPTYESIISVNSHSYNDFPFAADDVEDERDDRRPHLGRP
jgi:hypothetical protein